MKIQNISEFINGVATFNADPYCVENEEQAQELSDETHGELTEIVDEDELEDAAAKLDLTGHRFDHIYKCGSALVCLPYDFD